MRASTKVGWPRWVDGVLGAWLVASTLMWSPATATTVNGVAIGVLVVVASMLALRPVDVILGVWLFASTWVLPHTETLLLSDILTSLGIVVVALGFRMTQRHRATVTEWPDIPTTHSDHEPFVAAQRDRVSNGGSEGHGTMW